LYPKITLGEKKTYLHNLPMISCYCFGILDKSQYLDLESKYHLVNNAKRKNEKTIDLMIAKIKQKQKPYMDRQMLLHSER